MLERYFIKPNEQGLECYREYLHKTVDELAQRLSEVATPAPTQSAHMLKGRIPFSIIDDEQDFNTLLEKTLAVLVKQSVRVDHPHCAAHLHCPPLISSLAAEVILTTLNQSMDSWDQAPAATHIEQQMIEWLCQATGYSSKANGTFTSGGTQSNLMALLLARDHAMNQGTQTVQQQGLPNNFSRYKVLCSNQAHFSLSKSCALLGLGYQAIVPIASDDQGAMCINDLNRTLESLTQQGNKALAIVATAGTTDLGAIDSLAAIASLAQQYTCWLHVDAAYGGALLLSSHKKLLVGIEQADSVTIDFHKLFFQPISCSALLVKSEKTLSPVCFHADYLSRKDDCEPNLVDYSLSTTRRFDALKLWLSLQHMGLNHFNILIERLLNLAQKTADTIEKIQTLELLQRPTLSTVLFRLRPPQWQTDSFHQALRRHLLHNGYAVIAETRINNTLYLKLTLLNPCTSITDIEKLLDIIIREATILSLQVKSAS